MRKSTSDAVIKTINRRPSKIEYVGSNNRKQENSNKEAFTSSFINTDSNKKLEKNSDITNVKNTRFSYTEKSNLRITNNFNNSGNINVVLRCRPQNEKEKKISSEISINFVDEKTVSINSTLEKNNYKFTFDRSFDTETKQLDIFDYVAKPILNSVLDGFNGTIFAYGQTSSGKTFTMQGILDNPELEGITPRIIKAIYDHISNASEENQYIVKISLLEIYNEKIKDLIEPSKNNLQVREDKKRGIYIEDLSEHAAANSKEVLNIMKKGMDNRAVNATNMNAESSRSHSLVVFNIIHNNLKDLSTKISKLYLVDLAGSEKTSKTGATGQTLEEAKSINKSLTTLGLVINNLTESKKTHIPYRESKLTRILQESLGGNAKTCLIITCSPSRYNEAETLSTLRFGIRAKKVKNNAKINKDFSIAELKLQIEKLENEITKYRSRMNILENIMEDNGLLIPNMNESFCLDGLRNLLAQKTKEFKEFAIESNNTLINASESKNALGHKNKYIQEFLVENKNEELEENKNNKEFEISDEENKRENSYLRISEGEEENDSASDNNNNNNLEESKGNKSNNSLGEGEEDKDQINPISEDESEDKSDSDSVCSIKEKENSTVSKNKNKKAERDKLDRTENPNNITTGNAKYLELIEMFTKLDKKKSHIEEDLNYAIERIKEFKMDENRKNNLINDILNMKEKSTQKIDNLEGEIGDVINKTIIQHNHNESLLLNQNHLNANLINNKENKADKNNEILAELKNENEINTIDLYYGAKKEKADKQMIIDDDLNIQLTFDNKKDQNKIMVCGENAIKMDFVKEEKHLRIGKEELKILKENNEDAFNTSKNYKKSLEKSREVSLEINNTSKYNIKQNNPNNNSNYIFSSKLKDKKDNSIETGISINFNCDSSNKINLSNNEKTVNLQLNDIGNSRRISNNSNKYDFRKNQNSETNSKKDNLSFKDNDTNIDLDFLKTTNFAAGDSINLRNLIKENHSVNQDKDYKLNSNDGQNINVDIDTNNSKDMCTQRNNINFDNIINIKSEGKSLNSLTNILSNVVKNEQATPKLKTNFFKKYSNIGNNNNVIFNGINPKNISSNNNSVNSLNLNFNNLPTEKNNTNYLYQKDKNMSNKLSANDTNEKEISISKLKLSTPVNNEDEFITSTNPQTNNLLVNEFASSMDDDKNKVIEDLFYKLKEYSNKIPELNNLIETYKDKLNVKNQDNNANFANILNNHFNDNNDFVSFSKNNNNNDNKCRELIKRNSGSETKNNSIEQKLKLINIDNFDVNLTNFNYDNNKSKLSEKDNNTSKQANGNSCSEKTVNVSRDSKKTEEIISHLELKAEKLFENYFKKDKFDIKAIINDTTKNRGIDIKKYKNLKDYKI